MRGNVSGEVRQAINLRRVSSMRVSKESSTAASYPSQIATGTVYCVESLACESARSPIALPAILLKLLRVYCVESLACGSARSPIALPAIPHKLLQHAGLQGVQ
jgi:hypothetical protein